MIEKPPIQKWVGVIENAPIQINQYTSHCSYYRYILISKCELQGVQDRNALF